MSFGCNFRVVRSRPPPFSCDDDSRSSAFYGGRPFIPWTPHTFHFRRFYHLWRVGFYCEDILGGIYRGWGAGSYFLLVRCVSSGTHFQGSSRTLLSIRRRWRRKHSYGRPLRRTVSTFLHQGGRLHFCGRSYPSIRFPCSTVRLSFPRYLLSWVRGGTFPYRGPFLR